MHLIKTYVTIHTFTRYHFTQPFMVKLTLIYHSFEKLKYFHISLLSGKGQNGVSMWTQSSGHKIHALASE